MKFCPQLIRRNLPPDDFMKKFPVFSYLSFKLVSSNKTNKIKTSA